MNKMIVLGVIIPFVASNRQSSSSSQCVNSRVRWSR